MLAPIMILAVASIELGHLVVFLCALDEAVSGCLVVVIRGNWSQLVARTVRIFVSAVVS